MERVDAVDVLRTSSLFAGFTDEQLGEVTKIGLQRQFDAGEQVVSVGDPASSMWVILEGDVEIRVAGATIHRLGAGFFFGEIALLEAGATRSADVVALTDMTGLELRRSHLLGLIGGNPEISLNMIAELGRRLRLTTDALRRVAAAAPDAAAGAGVQLTDDVALGAIEFALAKDEVL